MTKKQKAWEIIRELLITALLVLIFSNVISYLRQPKLKSNKVPAMEVRLIDNSIFKPPKGHPLIIHFWGTWCPVCRMEAPNINWISKHYDVLTIAVNSGGNSSLKAFMRQKGLAFKVLNDPKGLWARRFRIHAFPTTFIYDSKGKLRFAEVGYTTTIGLLVRLWWVGLTG